MSTREPPTNELATNTASAPEGISNPYRYRPGAVALREIRPYRKPYDKRIKYKIAQHLLDYHYLGLETLRAPIVGKPTFLTEKDIELLARIRGERV